MHTNIVLTGDGVSAIDDDHIIKIGSHGFRMDNRTTTLRMCRNGDYISAAATHGREKQDHTSAIAS